MSHVCPAQFEIQNHTLQVIASDSFDLQPVVVDSFVSTSGERYDFVINANQSTGGECWFDLFGRERKIKWIAGMFYIRLKLLGVCEARETQQFAVLSYAPSTVRTLILSYPTRPFTRFTDIYGSGRVSESCERVRACVNRLSIPF